MTRLGLLVLLWLPALAATRADRFQIAAAGLHLELEWSRSIPHTQRATLLVLPSRSGHRGAFEFRLRAKLDWGRPRVVDLLVIRRTPQPVTRRIQGTWL